MFYSKFFNPPEDNIENLDSEYLEKIGETYFTNYDSNIGQVFLHTFEEKVKGLNDKINDKNSFLIELHSFRKNVFNEDLTFETQLNFYLSFLIDNIIKHNSFIHFKDIMENKIYYGFTPLLHCTNVWENFFKSANKKFTDLAFSYPVICYIFYQKLLIPFLKNRDFWFTKFYFSNEFYFYQKLSVHFDFENTFFFDRRNRKTIFKIDGLDYFLLKLKYIDTKVRNIFHNFFNHFETLAKEDFFVIPFSTLMCNESYFEISQICIHIISKPYGNDMLQSIVKFLEEKDDKCEKEIFLLLVLKETIKK